MNARAGLLLVLALSSASGGCSRDVESGGGLVLAQAPESTEQFGEVAPFQLTERSGKSVSRDDLLGRPWAASFIFTRCSGPCPRVTSTMKALSARLAKHTSRLVSLTVDPQWDTPAVLAEYAQNAGAVADRWWFLTGDEAAIYSLIQKSFLLPVERAPEGTDVGMLVSHRTQIVVVDKRGRIRGYYEGETDKDLDAIVARLAFLEREPDAR
ncbi:MAG: SCO family protein [Planctomycetota bacterium]